MKTKSIRSFSQGGTSNVCNGANAVIKEYNKEALYMKDFDEIVSYIRANAKANDLVLTLGAGTVTNIGPEIIKA